MSKPVVFVIGASGNVGSATVASLSEKYSDQVEIKAGVRNPDKASKLKALPNVEVVQATMGDSSLVSTLSGVTTLYIVTPSIENRVQVVLSTAESAKQAGVKNIAVVSVPGADSGQFAFGRQFNEIETKIAELGVNYTIICLPMFVENYWAHKQTIVSQGTVYGPTDPSIAITAATVEDMGKASAAILVNPEKYAGQKIAIISDIHSLNDFVKELSAALGKDIKYVRIPYEAAQKGMADFGIPKWQIDGLTELQQMIDAASPLVTQGDLGVFKRVTGEEPTNLKQWIAKYSMGFK